MHGRVKQWWTIDPKAVLYISMGEKNLKTGDTNSYHSGVFLNKQTGQKKKPLQQEEKTKNLNAVGHPT